MANNPICLTLLLFAATFAGCVSVENRNGLTPPRALFSHVRGTIGVPDGAVTVADAKTGSSGASFAIKEWVFTGISADAVDMAIQSAVRAGGLRKVHYADYKQTSYLGFVTVFDVTVYGE